MIKILILLCFFSSYSFSKETVTIVTFGHTDIKNEFTGELKKRGVENFKELDLKEDSLKKREGIYIALGIKALRRLIELNVRQPILTVFVSRSVFYHTIKSIEHNRLSNGNINRINNISVIYSDPPMSQQIRLLKGFFGDKGSFGVILSTSTYFLKDEITYLANKNNLIVKFIKYEQDDNINQIVNSLKNQNAILAIPDPAIWNPLTLKNLILSAYRNEQPIVGFSRNIVAAGAIGTSYVGLNQTIKDTVGLLKNLMDGENGVQRYSEYGEFIFNSHVLRSLGIHEPKRIKI